jgi:hypothetical protein
MPSLECTFPVHIADNRRIRIANSAALIADALRNGTNGRSAIVTEQGPVSISALGFEACPPQTRRLLGAVLEEPNLLTIEVLDRSGRFCRAAQLALRGDSRHPIPGDILVSSVCMTGQWPLEDYVAGTYNAVSGYGPLTPEDPRTSRRAAMLMQTLITPEYGFQHPALVEAVTMMPQLIQSAQ